MLGDEQRLEQLLNEHAIAAGELATRTWRELWQTLMVTFIDGSVKHAAAGGTEDCGCTKDAAQFSEAWKEKVVKDAGAHYLEPQSLKSSAAAQHDKPTISKLSIKGVAN